jgi:hypothetical protein
MSRQFARTLAGPLVLGVDPDPVEPLGPQQGRIELIVVRNACVAPGLLSGADG